MKMPNNINPFADHRYTPSEIEAAMPMNDKVDTLRCAMNAEIYQWYGRFLASAVLRATAAAIVGETMERMKNHE